MDPSMPDAIITGSALVLLLVTGSPTKPADFRNIGWGSNLPVIIRRLQRDFNRAVLETKIGFYTTVTRDIMARDNLDRNTIRKLWASGIVHPESKRILSYIRRNRYTPFDTLDVNQLHKDTIEFGQSAAGGILTQIARYSNILNQSTGLSNQGFIPAFTYRITGSMSLPYQSGDLMNDLALCPCVKRDGSRCNSNLADNNFTHFIGCKSHGFHIKHHNVLEDSILGCCTDGLRSRIIRG